MGRLLKRWAGLLVGLALAPLLVPPPAASLAEYAVDVPATSFTFSAGSGRTVLATLQLTSTGSAWAWVTTTSTTRRLSFQVATERCEGAPVIAVAVAGRTLMTREVAGSGVYAVVGTWPAGRHQVTFRFLNDHRTTDCDRNLRVSQVRLSAFANGAVKGVPVWQDAFFDYVRGDDPTLRTDGTVHVRQDSQGARTTFLRFASFPCTRPITLTVRIDGELWWSGRPPRGSDGWGIGELTLDRPVPNGLHDVGFEVSGVESTPTCNSLFSVWTVTFRGVV